MKQGTRPSPFQDPPVGPDLGDLDPDVGSEDLGGSKGVARDDVARRLVLANDVGRVGPVAREDRTVRTAGGGTS